MQILNVQISDFNCTYLASTYQKQVLSLDIVMNVALGVDVLQHVENLQGQVVRHLTAEQLLSGLEYFLQVIAESVHYQEAIFFVLNDGRTTATINRHTKGGQFPLLKCRKTVVSEEVRLFLHTECFCCMNFRV